jgi:hypothetical protein
MLASAFLRFQAACPPAGAAAPLEEEGSGEVVITRSRYVVAELPVKLQALRAPQDKPNPRLGVGEPCPPGANGVPGGALPWQALSLALLCVGPTCQPGSWAAGGARQPSLLSVELGFSAPPGP